MELEIEEDPTGTEGRDAIDERRPVAGEHLQADLDHVHLRSDPVEQAQRLGFIGQVEGENKVAFHGAGSKEAARGEARKNRARCTPESTPLTHVESHAFQSGQDQSLPRRDRA
ncbi:hypothetical protein ASA1KI_13750 [Opitutales bacterium ASA1]|nr:hypothetical protein ASA1KI_13750 [Opitutales bacterium ASA1]